VILTRARARSRELRAASPSELRADFTCLGKGARFLSQERGGKNPTSSLTSVTNGSLRRRIFERAIYSMAAPDDRLTLSPLNPTAASFTMPAPTTSTAEANIKANTKTQPMANGVNKGHNHTPSQDKPKPSHAGPAPDPMSTETKKLSGAELKKLKAAEKAARRKDKVTGRETQEVIVAGQQDAPVPPKIRRQSSAGKKDAAPFQASHKRTGSSTGKSLPVRPAPATASLEQGKALQEEKRVTFLTHLYDRERRPGIAGVGKEIHPAILTLGLQLRDHVICGGNARCAATLLAFKKVLLVQALSVCIPRTKGNSQTTGHPSLHYPSWYCSLSPPHNPSLPPDHPS
jgi:hypothetical protein